MKQRTRCIRGHQFTMENTLLYYVKERKKFKKVCRACNKARGKAFYYGRPWPRVPVHERFLRLIKKTGGGCWEWQGHVAPYGNFLKGVKAHRYSYCFYKSKIPKNKQIDHLCRNKACVNPNHLEAVTAKENTRRYHQIPKTTVRTPGAANEFSARARSTFGGSSG